VLITISGTLAPDVSRCDVSSVSSPFVPARNLLVR
jgi:hypothetical protein